MSKQFNTEFRKKARSYQLVQCSTEFRKIDIFCKVAHYKEMQKKYTTRNINLHYKDMQKNKQQEI